MPGKKNPKSQKQKPETHDGHGQCDPTRANACGKIAGCGQNCQQHESERPECLPAPGRSLSCKSEAFFQAATSPRGAQTHASQVNGAAHKEGLNGLD